MNTTFEEQKLRVDFTFRIVEAVKWIKIHPTPRTAGLPWGLSLATGLIIAVLSLGSHVVIYNPMLTPAGSPIPSGMKALGTGEISVDILRASQTPVIASKQTDAVDGSSALQAPQAQTAFISPAEEGEWTQKADMPTARFGLCTSVVNGKIYAIGGSTTGVPLSGDSIVSTVEQYDPATDNWTKKADMPTPRAWFSTSVVNGKIYAVGGRDRVKKVLSTVEEYDPLTDTWTQKADITARGELSTSAVGEHIYAIGGVTGWDYSGILSLVEEYDPESIAVEPREKLPTKWGGVKSE